MARVNKVVHKTCSVWTISWHAQNLLRNPRNLELFTLIKTSKQQKKVIVIFILPTEASWWNNTWFLFHKYV